MLSSSQRGGILCIHYGTNLLLKEDEQGLKQTIYATAGRRYQFVTRVFNRLLRNTALEGGCGDIIEGGLSVRRKDSLLTHLWCNTCLPVDLFNNQHNNNNVEQHSCNKPNFNGSIIIVDATFTKHLPCLLCYMLIIIYVLQAAADNKEQGSFNLALSHRHWTILIVKLGECNIMCTCIG